MKTLALLFLLSGMTGCVQTQFTKSVTVEKDASGVILRRTETESMVQPGNAWPMQFEHLKRWPGEPGSLNKSPHNMGK